MSQNLNLSRSILNHSRKLMPSLQDQPTAVSHFVYSLRKITAPSWCAYFIIIIVSVSKSVTDSRSRDSKSRLSLESILQDLKKIKASKRFALTNCMQLVNWISLSVKISKIFGVVKVRLGPSYIVTRFFPCNAFLGGGLNRMSNFQKIQYGCLRCQRQLFRLYNKYWTGLFSGWRISWAFY